MPAFAPPHSRTGQPGRHELAPSRPSRQPRFGLRRNPVKPDTLAPSWRIAPLRHHPQSFRCEQNPDRAGHDAGVSFDLPPGEAEHVVAEEFQASVAGAVVLEGGASAMSLPPVDLDDQPIASPKEIDLVVLDLHVDLRTRKAMARYQSDEHRLELGSGAQRCVSTTGKPGLGTITEGKAEEFRLSEGGGPLGV